MPHDIETSLARADDILKSAPNRPDPAVATARAQELLAAARDRLPTVADEARRLDLAAQIARRMADIDRTTFASIAPGPGVRPAPTDAPPDRVPPGQHLTAGWPVLHVGAPRPFDPTTWHFTVTGRVGSRQRWSWDEFRALPATTVTSDFHCVTGWSRLDNTWEGVRVRDVLARAAPRPEATRAVVSGEPAYSASLPLDDLLADDVLLAWHHDGKPLTTEHGGPLRLVVPARYGWKSVKWAFEIRLLDRHVRGYWEERGYHDEGDPWTEQRFRGD